MARQTTWTRSLFWDFCVGSRSSRRPEIGTGVFRRRDSQVPPLLNKSAATSDAGRCAARRIRPIGVPRGVQRTDAHSWGATVMAWYLRKNYDWRPQVKIEMDSTRLITCELPHTQGASATTYSAGSDRHIDLKWPSGFQHERQCRQPALSLPDLGLRISPRRLLVALRRR